MAELQQGGPSGGVGATSGTCGMGGCGGCSCRPLPASPPPQWHPGQRCSCGEKVMPYGLTHSELESMVTDSLYGVETEDSWEPRRRRKAQQRHQWAVQGAALLALQSPRSRLSAGERGLVGAGSSWELAGK